MIESMICPRPTDWRGFHPTRLEVATAKAGTPRQVPGSPAVATVGLIRPASWDAAIVMPTRADPPRANATDAATTITRTALLRMTTSLRLSAICRGDVVATLQP